VKGLNLTSYAKLNLYLEILGKRADNYHSIFTLFERINLSDRIRLKPLLQDRIRIVSSNPFIPKGRKNLAFQAASLLKKEFQIRDGVEINISKYIPISAGLAGGSSNAATVLAGLNKLWRLNLRARQLVALARQIGSDVPFFLYNCSFAYATQRGDKIKVLNLPVKLWHIIVVPPVQISTPLIYKRWDELAGAAGLTKHKSRIKILKTALLKKDILSLGRFLFNSLERASQALYPVIKKAKSALYDLGLEAILMSGSGPAVFGLVSSRKEAYTVARQLKVKMKDYGVFVARTV
jgi:4-diphosphocytidyl-2-C-methyl-D-erythritol kinase